MDHEVDVVEQDPLGLAIALDVGGVEAGFFQAKFDFVGDGLDLARVSSAADHEVIGESSGTFFEFQDGDFFGFFSWQAAMASEIWRRVSLVFMNRSLVLAWI